LVGELDGLERVDDDDAGQAADGLAVAEQVVVVAGDEGVVAGHQVGGEVLDVAELAAAGHGGPAGEEEFAQGGVSGRRSGVGAQVRPASSGVATSARPSDAAD
jgi:hypothetical protein